MHPPPPPLNCSIPTSNHLPTPPVEVANLRTWIPGLLLDTRGFLGELEPKTASISLLAPDLEAGRTLRISEVGNRENKLVN